MKNPALKNSQEASNHTDCSKAVDCQKLKFDPKNVTKNFGKAILKYGLKNPMLVHKIAKSLDGQITGEKVLAFLKKYRNYITSIEKMKEVLTEHKESKALRVLS